MASLLYWWLFALATGFAGAQEAGDRMNVSEPHIAVILPLQSPSFGKPADSVRLGILNAAANGTPGSLKVRIYATSEDPQQILAIYQRATSLGARAVIGPLTRNGVTALAQSGLISVPTVALNIPEGDIALPRDLFVYGLQIEAEARQTAQLAWHLGGRKALVIDGETPLAARIAQAFSEEWRTLGGEVTGRVNYVADATDLADLQEQITKSRADIVFMSLDAARARLVRPYLGSSLPIYATSLVFTSNANALANHDLEGVRFLDMPWLLQPDHPAVISYARPDGQDTGLARERFYALGIDAYRLAQELLHPFETMQPLDGVTGTITLNNLHQFVRTLVPAQFSQGSARVLDIPWAR
ncbi:MAG: penicillin-binding protein activator [Betaproteobacteria bacterium]